MNPSLRDGTSATETDRRETSMRQITLLARRAALLLALSSLPIPQIFAGVNPQRAAPGSSEDQKERIKERDRLGQRAEARRAEGRLDEAVEAAEGKLAIERQVWGAASEEALDSLDLIAALNELRDRWPASIAARREILALRRGTLGDGHWKAVDARWSLDRAETLARLGPDARRRIAEADRIDQVMVTRYAAGRYAEAEAMAREVAATRGDVLGREHPDYAESLNNLGSVLLYASDSAGARPLLERALAIRRRTLGLRHPLTALTLSNLGLLLKNQGDLAAARPIYEEALEVRRVTLGEDDPMYAVSLLNLAMLHHAEGNPAAARPLLEKAFGVFKGRLGESDPHTVATMNDLAVVLDELGDRGEATRLIERVLSLIEGRYGRTHPDYAMSLSNLAVMRYDAGDAAGARPLLEQVVALRREVLGERHSEYARALNNVAIVCFAQGDAPAALALAERSMALYEDRLARELPTLPEREQIALILQSRNPLWPGLPRCHCCLSCKSL
jgi:tetratricopeptide (TPR) repeat protein